ncbi:hypothetical protein [uncultured Tateyamaria sp.]|uniref:hypothetical protein n=1 Tax=uncultured Tateyamaria sp. TaxID=455651 RepID=UPI00261B5AE7|nr:hypothetical protein [uncultured Tateyamaria sp.]
MTKIINNRTRADLGVSTHGAVGTPLWRALAKRLINRTHDQPEKCHLWTADLVAFQTAIG